MPDIEDRDHDEVITIHIHENQETHRFDGEVTVGVNGTVVKIPIGTDTASTVAVAAALQGAGIGFSEVTPKGETGASAGGVSADATSFIAGEGDVDMAQANNTAPVAAAAPDASVDELSQTDLAGQIANAKAGGPRADNGLTVAETPAENADDSSADAPAADDPAADAAPIVATSTDDSAPVVDASENTATDADTVPAVAATDAPAPAAPAADAEPVADAPAADVDTAPIEQPIAALKADIQSVQTVAEIDALIGYEKAGDNRVGALNALEARKAEIEAA